jgi:hypothetical protein
VCSIHHLNMIDADEVQNDQQIEMAWAEQAFLQAATYMNLLKSTDPKLLNLTK